MRFRSSSCAPPLLSSANSGMAFHGWDKTRQNGGDIGGDMAGWPWDIGGIGGWISVTAMAPRPSDARSRCTVIPMPPRTCPRTFRLE